MATQLTQEQVQQLRDAGVPSECEDACLRIVVLLDRHNVTLNWNEFTAFTVQAPLLRLKIVEDFLATLNPHP